MEQRSFSHMDRKLPWPEAANTNQWQDNLSLARMFQQARYFSFQTRHVFSSPKKGGKRDVSRQNKLNS